MIEVDKLEKIQARNRVLLEEMCQEAERFIELLTAWSASGDEDLKAELEAQVTTLRIHAQVLEKSLEAESDAMPEDEE
jgi:hypothetical protein